jgi:hypothetical protein
MLRRLARDNHDVNKARRGAQEEYGALQYEISAIKSAN